MVNLKNNHKNKYKGKLLDCPRCPKAINNEIHLIEECEELDYLHNKETKYCYKSILDCLAHTKDFINILNLIILAIT